MSNGYLTTCALFIAIILFVIFISKKNINNVETRIFKKMLIIDIFEAFSTTMIVIISLTINSEFILKLLNRIDVIFIISWCSLMFYYIYSISIKANDIKMLKSIILLNLVLYFFSLFLDVKIINENGILNSDGPLTTLGFIGAVIYILMIFAVLVSTKIKKIEVDNKKYIPLFFLIFMLSLVAFARIMIPEINLISISLSLVDMIMMFTIENPDVKLLSDVRSAKNFAEKANRAKTDFLSSMSHEMRTPLNTIMGLSEDIMVYEDKMPKEVYEDAIDIQNASNRLLEIVENILDINMIETNSLKLNEIEYNFKSEIEKMCKITALRIENKNVKFNLFIDDNIPLILYGDVKKIKSIINNLLTNSIKYTSRGKIDLKITCNKEKGFCNLMIICRDTGNGIKEEYQQRLFNQFDRLDAEINSAVEGLGLGLSITKSLVEILKGKITIESKEGIGTTFIVKLKQKIVKIKENEEVITEEHSFSNSYFNKKSKRILIVDDNKLNIKVAVRLLSGFNFAIDEALSGNECLEMVKKNNYDLILMDIMMPGMNGEETFVNLCKNKDFSTPVMAVTADAVDGAKEKYKNIGFVDYLSKPFTREQIIEKLNNVFKK